MELVENRFRSIENQIRELSTKLEETYQWQQILEPWLLRTFNMNMDSLMARANGELERSNLIDKVSRISQAQLSKSHQSPSQQHSSNSLRLPDVEIRLKRKRPELELGECSRDNSVPPPLIDVGNRGVSDLIIHHVPTSVNVCSSSNIPGEINTNAAAAIIATRDRNSRIRLTSRDKVIASPTPSDVTETISEPPPLITIVRPEILSTFLPEPELYANSQSTPHQQVYNLNSSMKKLQEGEGNEEEQEVILTNIKIEPETEEFQVYNSILIDSPAQAMNMEKEEICTFSQNLDPPESSVNFDEFEAGKNIKFPSTSTERLENLTVHSTSASTNNMWFPTQSPISFHPGKSLVWQYFEKVGEIKAKCLICEVELSRTGGTTTVLRNHLKFRHKKEHEEFQVRVRNDLQIVKNLLKQHEQTLNTLMESQSTNYEMKTLGDESMFMRLPLATIDRFNALETDITRNEDLREKLICDLSSVGGFDTENVTKRIMTRLIANDLVDNISWIGSKKKLNFSVSSIKNVILAAVKQNPNSSCVEDKDIEQLMKLWLKHPMLKIPTKSDEPSKILSELDPEPESESNQSHSQTDLIETAPLAWSAFVNKEPTTSRKKARSSVYAYYDWDQSDGKYHCKYCSACYAVDKKSGSTSGLLRHARKHFASTSTCARR